LSQSEGVKESGVSERAVKNAANPAAKHRRAGLHGAHLQRRVGVVWLHERA
jgi:hypothetical protein